MNDPQEPTRSEMSDDVASAWAEVFIGVHERLEVEQAAAPEATSAVLPLVVAEQDVLGGDPPSCEEQLQA